ncbi:hypothetical protein GGI22_003411 [Coemansia erecta]|nr:hypothetical protein GGI22_003411 [Coemansia erecta]
MGVVSAVACCLHIAIHASIRRSSGESAFATTASAEMLAVERYSFAMSVTTLAATAVFGMLDLGGMVVLRGNMWSRSFFLRGRENKGGGIYGRSGGWHAASSPDLPSKLMGDDWLYHSGGNVYGTGRRPLALWRWWAFIEELVFGFRRNMGFIRLSIALLLALLWSPAIVQVAIVGYTGQCHMAVSNDGPSVVAGGVALGVCDLLRKALITSVFIWAAWSLMALSLLLVNTTSTGVGRARKDLMPYHIPGGGGGDGGHRPLSVGGLVPGTAGGPGNGTSVNASVSGGYPGTGALFSSKRDSNAGNMVHAGGQMPYNQGLFHPYQQIYHPYASAAPSTMGPKDFSTAQYRASWAHTDGGESVISSDMSRLEAQSIFHSQNNKHMLLPQQTQPNAVHQLHHLHPFHSLNQFQPPSRISEEQQAPEGNGDLYASLPSSLALAYSSAQRKARAAFYKTKYSTSISGGMADPLVNTAGSSAVHTAAASSTTHGIDGGAGEKILSRDGGGGGGAQRLYTLQHRHYGGGPPLPAGAEKRDAARSLARLSYESCDGALAIAARLGGGDGSGGGTNGGGGGWRNRDDSKTKRNTIG